MSDILLIDGNPDHVRPLSGLFKYRIKHTLDVAGDCVSGLRRIYANPPGVILINALLFASEDYGFVRALSEEPSFSTIRVVVLISGRLEEIRIRATEQFGAAILELPTSAGELNEAIEKAPGLRSRNPNPQAVTWDVVDSGSRGEPLSEKNQQPIVQRVSWQPFDPKPENDEGGVRPVNWATDGGKNIHPRKQSPRRVGSAPTRPDPPGPQASKRISREDAKSFRPAFISGGEEFQSLARVVEKMDVPEDEASKPFLASDFKGLPGVDPGKVKNR